MPSSQSSKTGVLGSGTGVLGSGPRIADPSVITGGTSTATSTPSSTLPATAPSNFLVIPGRIPSNDLNMANVSQFMRTTYYNASMYAAPTVIGARLKQNVALRDIVGRESLLQRRQQQLTVLDDQISNYHAEFGSRLNDKALDFLNKMANINVPTFTSILAGFENARASRADMEQKRISDLERIMTLDQQLQRDRMALRKEQMDAENMVANAMLEARTGQLKAYDDIAGKGVQLLSHSGQGTTLPIPQNVHSPDITPRAQGFSGLGGSGGAGTAAQRARAGQLATIMGGAKAGGTGATVTGEAATTGTAQEQVKPMQGETMSEVYVPASGDRNLLMALAVWKSGYDTQVATGRRPVTDMNGKNFAGAKKTLTDYFAANPDKLAVLKQYDPNAEQWLNSDDPAVFYKGFHDSWERGYKTRVDRALQSNGQAPSKYPGISETPAQTTTNQTQKETLLGEVLGYASRAGVPGMIGKWAYDKFSGNSSPVPTQTPQSSKEDPLRDVTPQQQSTGQPTSQATPVTNTTNTAVASNQPGIIGQAVEGAQMAASDAWQATKKFLGNVADNVVDFAGGRGVAYAAENPTKSSEDLAVEQAAKTGEYLGRRRAGYLAGQKDARNYNEAMQKAEAERPQWYRDYLREAQRERPFKLELRTPVALTQEGGNPVLSQSSNSANMSQTTTGIPTGQPAASSQRNIPEVKVAVGPNQVEYAKQQEAERAALGLPARPQDDYRAYNVPQDTGVLYPEMNSTAGSGIGEGLGTRLANAYKEGWEGAQMWVSDAWGQIKDGFNQDMESIKGALGGPTTVGVSDAGIARAYEGMRQSPYENWNVSPYDDPYAYGPRLMKTEPVAEPVIQATSQPVTQQEVPDNFIDRERATNRIRDALDTKLEQTYPLAANGGYEIGPFEYVPGVGTSLMRENPNRYRIQQKLEEGIEQGRYGTADADFVDQAFAAGYSEDDVINTLRMNFPPGYDRMAYLRRVARPITEYTGLPENLERNPYEELSEGMTPQFNYSDEFGLPEMPGTQAEAQPEAQPEAQGGGYAADAESMAGMIETPDVNVDAGTTPTLSAQPAQPAQPAPQNAEFFQDANTYMQQYAQPPVQYAQPSPPPPQNYIPGGTRIAAGRIPQVDPYMARGVDPYGNFYPLPGQAQGYGRYRRPDDWTVINEYDRRLRNQNDLDLEAVGAAFRQWFLNNAGGPPAQFHPTQVAPTGSNFNYMPSRYYPQERYTVPQYQLSPEQQQLIESKLQNFHQRRAQLGIDPSAPATAEELWKSGLTQEEVDALAAHYDAIRSASAYGNAMADVPAANQVYMTNAGLQRQAQAQAQLPPGAYNTYGNVKPSANIKTKSGVSLQGMNDELMNRMNRMAQILKDEFGMDLTISSGRRTQAEQVALYRRGKNRVAAPGRSPHQHGNAFDVAIDSSMIPQFNRNQKARAAFNGNFNAFWNYVVNKAGLYRFDPVNDKFHHALPPGWRQARSSSGNKKKIADGISVPMSSNITLNKGVRWDGLHSYMKELLNAFGDNMMRKYGVKPHFRHMHRTKAEQKFHYDEYRAGRGGIAASPGSSIHQAGLAADLDWPRLQTFFNSRPDLKQAYGNDFWRWLNTELAEVGLHRPLGMKDRPHIQPIENARYHARVNHRLLMSSRGTWDAGGAQFEIGGTSPQVQQFPISGRQLVVPGGGTQSSLGQFWGAPEGNQARAIAYGRAKGREIKGWGTGPGRAQPFNFTSSPLFNQLVNRTARENGVDPQASAAFLNMIMNITAMGETGLGTHQIGIHDKKDKGTFGIRDITFNEVKGKSKYYGRGLDPNLQRKFATARDVYDLTTEEQALLVLTVVSGFKGPYRRIMQQGAQAVASGDRNAIRNALLNYITTLHWGGGSVDASIANVNRAIRGGAKWYGPSGEYFFNQRVAPMYLKRIDDYLNYISRGR